MPYRYLAVLFLTLLSAQAVCAVPPDSGTNEPQLAPESDEGEKALAGFKIPDKLTGSLFAAEPLLANPVAIYVDDNGQVYVCETFRQKHGVEDNRNHGEWLDEDLAAQTVADRLAYIKKHLGDKAVDYTQFDDRIRLLTDTDEDGQADKSTVFAAGFNDIVDGTGAGVLLYKGNVYYTCIPNLWLLKDKDGDGKSDSRKSLLTGFGVRFAFRGHDMHGLTIGPDGRLYWSIGDRGYNVEADGRRWVNPESGAVFRCELDGSNFEVFATGLRNPQELAFDEYGNLFTGDNNSDSGDKARWVYVVEGGDSGWRMAYQYLPDRGPFNREKIWHPYHEGQPAYIVPPVANIADGPSGLAYYPGTGMPDDFQGRFFLCDFRGQSSNSGVRSFRVKPKGGFFELVDEDQPFWNILATDIAFAPDGAVMISDWVHGWDGLGKGRIYRFADESKQEDETVQEVKELLGSESSIDAPALLAHPDQRIRQRVQWALATRHERETLHRVAKDSTNQLARIHAIWGLGQSHRLQPMTRESLFKYLAEFLTDDDPEIRAQAARVVGDAHILRLDTMLNLLKDPSPRVRAFAAVALGKLGPDKEVIQPLLEMLAENKDEDPILRHAGVMGLAGAGDEQTLAAAVGHHSPSARMGVLLAMRRRQDPEIVMFLLDQDERLVVEAARAIHDVPIAEAMPMLAEQTGRSLDSEPLLRRALNANFRLGQKRNAEALAEFSARQDAPENMRIEALEMLAAWSKPSNKDRVLGMWRPLEPRDPLVAQTALRPALGGIISGPEKVRVTGAKVAARLGVKEVAPALRELLSDQSLPADSRADALLALAELKAENLRPLIDRSLDDKQAAVRAAARRALSGIDPATALESLATAIVEGELVERQGALAALADMPAEAAAPVLADALKKLAAGKIAADTQLDVLTAAKKNNSPELQKLLAEYEAARPADDPLAAYREALAGGSAERGRTIFFERREVSCVRCHKIDETGGDVGPDLSKIATDKTREYLLEALVLPDKTIAKNYESVVLLDIDGLTHTGIVRHEDDDVIRLMKADGEIIEIEQDNIDARRSGKSAMPEDLVKQLTKSDIRDLVEFLAERK